MRIPKKFVGLHAHDGNSVFDGLGPPKDHIDYVIENGMNAWAQTNHGHMNGFASAFLYQKKLKEKGVNFKFIGGCEAYIHPDLNQWKIDKQTHASAQENKKLLKKLQEKEKKNTKTDIIRVTDEDDETVEMTNAMTIENEDETKSGKIFNPINRRHHIVLLPKTSRALKKLFRLVSKGYLEGFYRFPRIDLNMLKEACSDGEIVVGSACLGGFLSYATFQELKTIAFDDLNSSLLDNPLLLKKCITSVENTFDQYANACGRENLMVELQFNKLPAQDVVNRVLLEFAKKNNLTNQLIVTADSHYARPELWKHREMYKKLGYLNYSSLGPDSIPKSIEDIKCELYPKNATQIWNEYQKSKTRNSFYNSVDDELICDAIERTHDIAHNVIGDVTYDTSYKYPKLAKPGKTEFQLLCELCRNGMIKKGLENNKEYVDRMKHELQIIKKLDNSSYFVLLARVLELSREVCLVGIARGSSGGSLVCYLVGITDLDPIKYKCRFDRFQNIHRKGSPDVDCDVGNRDLVLDKLRKEYGYNNVIPISNINTFKIKTLVKDISKFFGIPFDEVNEATRTVEQDVRKATHKHGDDKNLFLLTFPDACKHSPKFKAFIDKHSEITESINILFKEQRALGRHAGGTIILDDAMDMMPLITSKGEPQTPWIEGVSTKTLEPLGLLKLDLLGLEMMRLVERTIELILIKQGKPHTFQDVRKWYEENLHPDVNNYDDQKVYEYVYHDGNFAGVFQLTSKGSQNLFLKAKPTSIVDIAALTSIYRPGPLSSGADKIYLDAKQGKMFDWGHPLFDKVLGDTYNCLAKGTKIRVSEHEEVLIEHIVNTNNVGLNVLTYNQKTQKLERDVIVAVADNGVQELLEIETDDGVIRCTQDHQILTSSGWKRAIDLLLTDEILSVSNETL